jgi:hypothetical protein
MMHHIIPSILVLLSNPTRAPADRFGFLSSWLISGRKVLLVCRVGTLFIAEGCNGQVGMNHDYVQSIECKLQKDVAY